MTFNDTLKYDLAIFPTIFPDRAAVLNQLFCVNGSGYDWDEVGNMSSRCGDTCRDNEVVAIERYIGAGLHKETREDAEYIPPELDMEKMFHV